MTRDLWHSVVKDHAVLLWGDNRMTKTTPGIRNIVMSAGFFVVVLLTAGASFAQGVPITNVPTIPGKNDMSKFPGGVPVPPPPGKNDPNAPKQPTRADMEINYMMALGGQGYMKQACGDGSWRQDMETAKQKLQPENQLNGVKAFQMGWNDSKKRFGSKLNICDKIKAGGGVPQITAASPVPQPSGGGLTMPDVNTQSVLGVNGIRLQPTVQKPD